MTASTEFVITVIFLVEAEFAVQRAIRDAQFPTVELDTGVNTLSGAVEAVMANPDSIALTPETVMTGAEPDQVAEFAQIVGCSEDKVAEKVAEYYKLINAMSDKHRRNSRKLAVCVAFYDGDTSDQGKALLHMSVSAALKQLEEAQK